MEHPPSGGEHHPFAWAGAALTEVKLAGLCLWRSRCLRRDPACRAPELRAERSTFEAIPWGCSPEPPKIWWEGAPGGLQTSLIHSRAVAALSHSGCGFVYLRLESVQRSPTSCACPHAGALPESTLHLEQTPQSWPQTAVSVFLPRAGKAFSCAEKHFQRGMHSLFHCHSHR